MKKDIEFNEELKNELNQFTVDFPSEDQIKSTISILQKRTTSKPHPLKIMYLNSRDVLKLAYHELFFISPLFWALNFIFLFLGIVNVSLFESSPYTTLFLMTPIPLMIGFIEMLKSKDLNLLELESTTKFSWEHIVYSKLLIISIMHFITISTLMGWISSVLKINLIFSELLQYWVLPTLVFTSFGLFITLHFSRKLSTYILIAFWFVFLYISQNLENYNYIFEKFGTNSLVFFILICLIIIGVEIKYLTKRGGVYIGTSYS